MSPVSHNGVGLWARAVRQWKTGHVLPWRWSHLGGPVNTVLLAPRRRRRLPDQLQRAVGHLPDAITVIIGVRNRADYRLINAMASVRGQRYPRDLVRLVVVDYSSDDSAAAQLRGLTADADADAQLIRVEGQSVWNRSHCLNVAIRRADTKFVLCSDADVLLSPDFISATVDALKRQPLTVVYSTCLDLPQSCTPTLQEAADHRRLPDLAGLKLLAAARDRGVINAGIQATYTWFYHWIGGYDEQFRGWGKEDNDLQRRFLYLGLTEQVLTDPVYYLHQWHPKFEGVNTPDLDRLRAANARRLATHYSIRRNGAHWGQA